MSYNGLIKVAQKELLKRLGHLGSHKLQASIAGGSFSPEDIEEAINIALEYPSRLTEELENLSTQKKEGENPPPIQNSIGINSLL